MASFKKIGLIIAGSVLWGGKAPMDELTAWHLQHTTSRIRSGEFESLYVKLPFIKGDAVRERIRRLTAGLESQKANSVHFGSSGEDTETFIEKLRLIFPKCSELGVVIFGTTHVAEIYQQKLIEFAANSNVHHFALLTSIGIPDCQLLEPRQLCRT